MIIIMIFFTSDSHFWHRNIIKFCNRPFSSVEEMNQKLIENWNNKVGPDDEVYHLGDFGFSDAGKLKNILDQLNGKIYFVKGNHDKPIWQVKDKLEWIKDYHEFWVPDQDVKGGKQFIVLCHYAFRSWNKSHYGSWNLYGHSHGTLPDDETQLAIDVGVDCHDFAPISYNEVKRIMKKKKWVKPF